MSHCAAIQMVSSADLGENLAIADRLILEAARAGAKLAALPENFALMGRNEADKLAIKESDGAGPIQDFLAAAAQRHGVWLIGGTIPIVGHDATRVRAACLVYDAHGQRVARYDKIHLFDVKVPGTSEIYRESNTIEPGENDLVIDTPFGRLGIAVCYDLRFPEFFRRLADRRLDLLVIPAAFTAETGAAHWEVLLRARAIENLCYVIAPNQGGTHANGRKTYGHSMVVDPWGVVLDCYKTGNGFAIADIDPERLEKIRAAFPALQHRRF